MPNQRNAYMDFLKGVGILLVVFGHLTDFGQPWRMGIYGFHIPLFFLLSGVFASCKAPFSAFFLKKLRTLYVPYAAFLTLDIGLACVLQIRAGLRSLLQSVAAALPRYVGVRVFTRNAPIWFLFVLFILQILYYFLSKQRILLYIAAAATVPLTVLLAHIDAPKGNLWLNAIPAFGFFVLGSALKEPLLRHTPPTDSFKSLPFWLSILLLFPYAVSAVKNGNVDILWHHYGNRALVFYLNACAGCILYFFLCAAPYRQKQLRRLGCFFGRNSVYVLCTHYYLTQTVCAWAFETAGREALRFAPWMEPILFFVITLCLIPVVRFCRRFLSPVFGQYH